MFPTLKARLEAKKAAQTQVGLQGVSAQPKRVRSSPPLTRFKSKTNSSALIRLDFVFIAFLTYLVFLASTMLSAPV
ncbi:hypothetical protein CDL15_Pgr017593 [Punica granatum]|nr:hypothetical protein CDL15_Pgr017593 [Punica granatum]